MTLAEGILPCLSDDQIEAIAERELHREITPTEILLISSLRDKKRTRQLLLSKKQEYPSYISMIEEHFSHLFTHKEMNSLKNNQLGVFGAEIIYYRLRHPLHDGWTKTILSKSKHIPKEDGKLFLDQLLALPPSQRRTEMAAYVYAASHCDHEALENRAFYIQHSEGEDIHLHIPREIDRKLRQASVSKDTKFLKTFFANFAAIIGSKKGAKIWFRFLLNP